MNPCSQGQEIYNFGSPFLGLYWYILSLPEPDPWVEKRIFKKYINLTIFTPKLLPLGVGLWKYNLSCCLCLVSLPYRCYTPYLVKIVPVVLEKKMLTHDGRRRTATNSNRSTKLIHVKLRFHQPKNLSIKNGDFSSKLPIFFLKSHLFHWIRVTLTIFVTLFAAECLKLKSLIYICTSLHILSSISKHMSLCRIDLHWGQVGKTFLKWSLYFFLDILYFESEVKVDSIQMRMFLVPNYIFRPL